MIRILKNRRTIVKIWLDIFFILFAGMLASFILYNKIYQKNIIIILIYLTIDFLIASIRNNIAVSWSYTDTRDVLSLVSINVIATLIIGIFLLINEIPEFKFLFLLFIFSTSLQLLLRLLFRIQKKEGYSKKVKGKISEKLSKKKALIYGAGEAGISLLRESRLNKNFPYKICGFLDDDSKKNLILINGIKVYGNGKKA
ncbi:MAG: hypothetical protein Q7K47_08740 [Fusobacterium sp. JB019]|nr:hypothetical protein [Fusobacterium sp. JB019]